MRAAFPSERKTMNLADDSSAAARLCAPCGMCCNGVMFHTVQLQPDDSAKRLAALGLKLKRKHGHHFILQPCPAFENAQCSIYAARPERCRKFECRQLLRLTAGEITEAAALENIHATQRLVAQLNALLLQAGRTNFKHPISKRYEKAMAEPVDPGAAPEVGELRRRLAQTMQALQARLNADFRIVPDVAAVSPVVPPADDAGK